MTANSDYDDAIYTVVVNGEGQYSIWPSQLAIPRGWRSAGKEAPKAECLQYIDKIWTDMRPLSLRRKVDVEARESDPRKEFDINP